jgi:hypothetical protein
MNQAYQTLRNGWTGFVPDVLIDWARWTRCFDWVRLPAIQHAIVYRREKVDLVGRTFCGKHL